MLKNLYFLSMLYYSTAYAWISQLDFRHTNPTDQEQSAPSVTFAIWIINGLCLILCFLFLIESGKKMKDLDFYGAFKSFLGAIIIALSGRLAFKMLYF